MERTYPFTYCIQIIQVSSFLIRYLSVMKGTFMDRKQCLGEEDKMTMEEKDDKYT